MRVSSIGSLAVGCDWAATRLRWAVVVGTAGSGRYFAAKTGYYHRNFDGACIFPEWLLRCNNPKCNIGRTAVGRFVASRVTVAVDWHGSAGFTTGAPSIEKTTVRPGQEPIRTSHIIGRPA
jgi:hypothetical protein